MGKYPRSAELRDGRHEHVGTEESPKAPTSVTVCVEDLESDMIQRIRDNVGLVAVLVAERRRRVPRHVNHDDLVSAGMMALVLSARAYDPGRGVPFPAFAAFRIRLALTDELRAMDWVPRSVRRRVQGFEKIRADLIATLDRSPRLDDIARAVGISTREVTTVYADLAQGTVLSLQSFATDGAAVNPAGRSEGPESIILQREQLAYLHDAIEALPERLRFVVVAYYFEERQMSHIAIELSVTQSRVSQLCTEATALIRDGMNSQLNPDALPLVTRNGRFAQARTAYYAALADRNTIAGRLDMSTTDGQMRQPLAC